MTEQQKQMMLELEQMEKVIECGNSEYWRAGMALRTICERQLYRLKFPTFKEYVDKRWHMTPTKASRIMVAAFTRHKLLLNKSLAKELEGNPADISFYMALSKLAYDQQEKTVAKLLATKATLSDYQVRKVAGTTKDENYYKDLAYRRTLGTIKKMVKDKDLNRFFKNASVKYGANIRADFVSDMKKLIEKLSK